MFRTNCICNYHYLSAFDYLQDVKIKKKKPLTLSTEKFFPTIFYKLMKM